MLVYQLHWVTQGVIMASLTPGLGLGTAGGIADIEAGNLARTAMDNEKAKVQLLKLGRDTVTNNILGG